MGQGSDMTPDPKFVDCEECHGNGCLYEIHCNRFPPAPLNHETLLAKYIRHVMDVEGSDFLEQINGPYSGVRFDAEEIAALDRAAGGSGV